MKSFYKALLVLSLMPLITLGQSNYKAGYIVTLKGDTLRGFIDDKDWDSNPTSINFKNGITDPVPNKYTTTEIGLFNVEGLTFQKYTVSISMDETNISRLSNGKDTSFRTDNVFLQVLQKRDKCSPLFLF